MGNIVFRTFHNEVKLKLFVAKKIGVLVCVCSP